MRKEKFIKRFLVSKIFLFLSVIIFSFLLFVFGKKFLESREIDKEIKTAEEEIAKLESRDSELGGLLNYLNTDVFLEEEARLKFSLQKPGESVVVIPKSGAGETDSGQGIALAEKKEIAQSNPEKWWNYFFGAQGVDAKTRK